MPEINLHLCDRREPAVFQDPLEPRGQPGPRGVDRAEQRVAHRPGASLAEIGLPLIGINVTSDANRRDRRSASPTLRDKFGRSLHAFELSGVQTCSSTRKPREGRERRHAKLQPAGG